MTVYKKVMMSALITSVSYILFDCLLIYPYLRSLGFYSPTGVTVRDVVDNQLPNNIVPHPKHIWAYLPNSYYHQSSSEEHTSIDVRINSAGFRDEAPEKIGEAEFEFVALGDSFTFGSLVQVKERWDEQLADMLTGISGRSSASRNFGMWSTTFDQHALLLEENFPARTKVVVHLVYPPHVQTIQRHVIDVTGDQIIKCWDPLRNVKNQSLYYGSADDSLVIKELKFPYLYSYFRFVRNKRKFDDYINRSRSIDLSTDLYALFHAEREAVFQTGWEKTTIALRQIASLCRKKRVPYVVVIIPMDRQLSLAEWNGALPVAEMLTNSLPQDRIRSILDGIDGVKILDLLPYMRRAESEFLYYKYDPHWRPAGHRFAAEAILDLFLREGYVQDRRSEGTPITP